MAVKGRAEAVNALNGGAAVGLAVIIIGAIFYTGFGLWAIWRSRRRLRDQLAIAVSIPMVISGFGVAIWLLVETSAWAYFTFGPLIVIGTILSACVGIFGAIFAVNHLWPRTPEANPPHTDNAVR